MGFFIARPACLWVRAPAFAAAATAFLLLAAATAADSPARGDGDFRVLVEDAAGADGLGVFGATDVTGADVLGTREGIDALGSYVTVRSYTTGTDYVQTSRQPASGFLVVPLETYGSVLAIDGGWRTFYQVPATSPSAEALTMGSDITSSAGSGGGLVLSTSITNRNDYPISVGVRYLLDVSAGGDDGPVVAAAGVGSPIERGLDTGARITISEAPGGSQLQVESPTLAGDAPPDAIKIGHWNRAFDSAFDFEPSGVDVASAGGLDDSALLHYFGATEASALRLGPEETVRVSIEIGVDVAVETPSPVATPTPTAPPATPSATATEPPAPTATPRTGTSLPNTGGNSPGGESVWLVAIVGAVLAAGAGLLLAYSAWIRRPQV